MASKMASKVVGAGKGAIKALEGYSGIFHHLAGEHAEVSTLMKGVAATGDDDKRSDGFAEVRRNLLAHAKGEEAEFYPVLREYSEISDLVGRCLDEHKDIERRLEELNVADKASAGWRTSFETLMSTVEQHVEREEKELFPKANDLLESSRARSIEERYEKVEEQEKSRL